MNELLISSLMEQQAAGLAINPVAEDSAAVPQTSVAPYIPGAGLKASVSPNGLGKDLWVALGHLDELIIGSSLLPSDDQAAAAHERFVSNPTCSVLYWNSKHTTEFYRLFKGHEKEREIEKLKEDQEIAIGIVPPESVPTLIQDSPFPRQKSKSLFITEQDPENHYVFRQYLVDAQTFSSRIVKIGGHEHDVPIVVFACCEEICRRGITRPDLFRLPANSERIQILKDVYNTGPSFGRGVSLKRENVADICSLLRLYIEALRYSPLNSAIYDAFQTWCVIATFDSQRIGSTDPKASAPSIQLVYNLQGSDQEEELWVEIAATLIKLLPAANCALLVYMLNFCCKVLYYSNQNLLQVEDICRLFGGTLLAPNRLSSDPDANSMMAWILKRWYRIHQKLFDIPLEIS